MLTNLYLFLQVLDEKITYPKHKQEILEVAKAQGTLSSMVIFINRQKLHKEIVSNIDAMDLTAYTEVSNI